MISIIVPVYNTARYLNQCIESIHNQIYTDWECILVDDGSKDDSGRICDAWAKKDSRFIVVHKENQGVSAARNDALVMSKGEYVFFVDSDDWIDPDYLATFVGNVDSSTYIAVGGMIREYRDGSYSVYSPEKSLSFDINSENISQFNKLNELFLLYTPHEKLFKSEIIKNNKICFEVGCSYGEDLQFVYEYLRYCSSISTIDKALYHYRILETDSLSSRFRPEQFEQDYKQWKIVYDYYATHGLLNEESQKYLARRLWGIVYDGIFLYPKLMDKNRLYIRHILSIPEVGFLCKYSDCFQTASWIKIAIMHRLSFIFEMYFSVLLKVK